MTDSTNKADIAKEAHKDSEKDAKNYFRSGKKYFKKGNVDGARLAFERAYRFDNDNAEYMSYHGLCEALRWSKIGYGLELCTRAIKRDFTNPEFYVNLARVYKEANNKKGALTALKKGLRFKPEDKAIHEMLIELGARKRQIIPFLKRSNIINRMLGTFFRRTLTKKHETERPDTASSEEDLNPKDN